MSKFSKKINTIGFLGVFVWVCLLMANPVFPGRSFGSEIPKERLKPGSPALKFRYKDIKGNWVELKDFKGKYVYIDIWATWCGPCKAEIPHLQQLEKEMKGKKIVFVSISCDENKAEWEKYVKKQCLGGVQLYMGKGKDMKNFYQIEAIPRFILLDKKGNIVDAYMTRPSDEKTKKTLIKLKGI